MLRPVNFMSVQPLQHFLCYEVSSLVRSNVVWSTMMVDEHSVNPYMVVLAEALHAGKANLYPEQVSIPVRTKCYPFHKGSDPI